MAPRRDAIAASPEDQIGAHTVEGEDRLPKSCPLPLTCSVMVSVFPQPPNLLHT